MPVPRIRAMLSPGEVRILLQVRFMDDPQPDHAGDHHFSPWPWTTEPEVVVKVGGGGPGFEIIESAA